MCIYQQGRDDEEIGIPNFQSLASSDSLRAGATGRKKGRRMRYAFERTISGNSRRVPFPGLISLYNYSVSFTSATQETHVMASQPWKVRKQVAFQFEMLAQYSYIIALLHELT